MSIQLYITLCSWIKTVKLLWKCFRKYFVLFTFLLLFFLDKFLQLFCVFIQKEWKFSIYSFTYIVYLVIIFMIQKKRISTSPYIEAYIFLNINKCFHFAFQLWTDHTYDHGKIKTVDLILKKSCITWIFVHHTEQSKKTTMNIKSAHKVSQKICFNHQPPSHYSVASHNKRIKFYYSNQFDDLIIFFISTESNDWLLISKLIDQKFYMRKCQSIWSKKQQE